jgi:type VI secretion system protein
VLPLVVRVEGLQTKEPLLRVFDHSPIRIGRNNLNDLPLDDPFVSLWHGMLRFDERGVQYMDLASTNGSQLDGAKLGNNTFVPLGEDSVIRIGPLKLHISRSQVPVEAPVQRSNTLFQRRVTSGAVPIATEGAPAAVPSPTLHWHSSGVASGSASTPPALQTTIPPQAPRAIPVGSTSVSDEGWAASTANALLPRYMKYREAWATLKRQVFDAATSLPEARRPSALQLLLRRLPALGQEAEFRTLLGDNGAQGGNGRAVAAPTEANADATMLEILQPGAAPSPSAGADGHGGSLLKLFAETYAPDAQRTGARDLEQFLHQLASTLESFAQAFVELSRGHEEFRTQMAVPTAGDSSLRRGANTARDILRRLLETGPEGAARVRDLTRGFADVMVHQVALLSGMREGVRALLVQLDPAAFTGKPPGNRFAVTLGRLNAFRGLMAWKAYVRRYHELTEEDRAIEGVLFGPEFAYAYTRVIGGPVADRAPQTAVPALSRGR